MRVFPVKNQLIFYGLKRVPQKVCIKVCHYLAYCCFTRKGMKKYSNSYFFIVLKVILKITCNKKGNKDNWREETLFANYFHFPLPHNMNILTRRSSIS